MSLAVLERPRVSVPVSVPVRSTPSRRSSAPLAAAAIKAACVYALVAGLITAVHWPVISASDAATRWGLALQIAMTATFVGGWFSLILIFDRFIGEPAH